MARNFPDFLTAYQKYAFDDFAPDMFHTWTGLSLISGVLERKVWLVEGKIIHYPNTFILLVGGPAAGKSTAIRRGVPLIERLRAEDSKDFKVFSGLMTQAGLCTEMNQRLSSYDRPNSSGGSTIVQFSSGYYYVSEASDSGMQNLHGDFNATITAMYDCDDRYVKTLKIEKYDIPNPSLCVLGGSTFDFLKTLVNQSSVMGGLASRFVYVVSKERKEQESTWGTVIPEPDEEMRRLLYADLLRIHRLVGNFRIEKDVFTLYATWWKKYQQEFLSLQSERMQSIISRKPTLLKKVLMLLSASEREDLVITPAQLERAIVMVEEVTKDNNEILSSAITGNRLSQDAINQFIMRSIGREGEEMDVRIMKQKFIGYGGDISKYDATIKMLSESGMIKLESSDRGQRIKLLVNPDHYL